MAQVRRFDAVTGIRWALANCSDEHPPSATTELLFINDPELRENIRRDLGAMERALNNAEWKAATVLAGATIEALLHWWLQARSPGPTAVQAAATLLAGKGTINKPHNNIDRWELHQFIEVAGHLGLLKPDTCSAARLAQNFRNLVHPGRAAPSGPDSRPRDCLLSRRRAGHVIRDLS